MPSRSFSRRNPAFACRYAELESVSSRTRKTTVLLIDTSTRSIHRFARALKGRERGKQTTRSSFARKNVIVRRADSRSRLVRTVKRRYILANSSDNPLGDPCCRDVYFSSPSFTVAPHRAATIRQRPTDSNAPRLFRQATVTMSRRYICIEGRSSPTEKLPNHSVNEFGRGFNFLSIFTHALSHTRTRHEPHLLPYCQIRAMIFARFRQCSVCAVRREGIAGVALRVQP